MQKKNKIGHAGEQAAVNFLTNKGYRIRERNWRAGHLELDIIAEFDEFIVFAEVKTRSGTYFQQPFQAVNHKKQRKIIKAANIYIEKNKIELEARFDIISIVKTGSGYDIEHIEDAFYPRV